MNATSQPNTLRRTAVGYRWVHVVVASIAMTATLPGRTHGLGLITETLLADFAIDRMTFANLNFAAAILGACFCLPVGWAIDRWGTRPVFAAVTLALGLSVIAISRTGSVAGLMISLLLVRGLGQSSLSLVSVAVVAKWFRGGVGVAMGVFAVLLTFGFIAAVLGVGAMLQADTWRSVWFQMGVAIAAASPMFWLLVRNEKAIDPLSNIDEQIDAPENESPSMTLGQAIATPSFWALLIGSALFNFVWSGVTLFNESILATRGVAAEDAVGVLAILTGAGLVANLVGGGLASRQRVMKVFAVGMAFLAAGLASLLLVDGSVGVQLYAVAIGLSGGIVTVVFFAAWRHRFGSAHLGRIQGAGQIATVVASACGPVAMASTAARTGSYDAALLTSAVVAAIITVVALILPSQSRTIVSIVPP